MAVNTHQHGDHTYGNSLLPAATVLIGHERMREGLRTDPVIDGCPAFWAPVPDWGPVQRRLPDVAITASTRDADLGEFAGWALRLAHDR